MGEGGGRGRGGRGGGGGRGEREHVLVPVSAVPVLHKEASKLQISRGQNCTVSGLQCGRHTVVLIIVEQEFIHTETCLQPTFSV